MSDYIISACAPADLTKEQFDEYDIKCVYFHYFIDGEHYYDDLGQTMDYKEFYKRMVEGADMTTSQVNPEEFVEYFTPYLEAGKDVIHFALSSGISGSYNSARIAKEELQEKFPDRRIEVVDTLAASSGFGLFVVEAAIKRKEGATIDELYKWAMDRRLNLQHWFFSTDLTFFVKGGRVSKTSGFIGNVLNICPLMNVNNEGKLIVREKVRTKKKVYKQIVKMMEEHAENGLDYSGKCFISMSDCIDDARAVAELIEERFPKLDGKVVINYIGTTIGTHTGPGTVALFFWGDEREE